MKTCLVALCLLAVSGCSGNMGPSLATGAASTAPVNEASRRAHESVLYSFGGNDGAAPINGMISDHHGGFYGTTLFGGAAGGGEIFAFSPAGTGYALSTLYSFAGGNDGAKPWGITERNGALFGSTFGGGGNGNGGAGWGTVFELSPTKHGLQENILHRFAGEPDGGEAIGPVVLDRKGNIYGITGFGGAYNRGAVFEVSPNGTGYSERVLYSFPGGAGGEEPQAGVTIDKHDVIYGTTMYGGNYLGYCSGGGCGTVFKLTPGPSGYTESIAYAFQGSDGNLPFGVPTVDEKSGAIYGTTYWGGSHGDGAAYKLTPHGTTYTATVLHSFAGNADGFLPEGQLLLGSDGTLYGTAALGGGGCHGIGCGVVFAIKPQQKGYALRVLTDFRRPVRGAEPEQTNLVTDPSGALYGTTRSGNEDGLQRWGPRRRDRLRRDLQDRSIHFGDFIRVIAILGAGGAIGDSLAKMLLAKNVAVRLVGRNPKAIDGTQSLTADLSDAAQSRAAVEGAETACLLAGLRYDLTIWREQWPRIMRNVIEACKHSGTKLLFFDNVYMYGRVDEPMTEATPYRPSSKKGEIRAAIATLLMDEARAGNLQAMIARAADFYGPQTKNGVPNVLVLEPYARGGTASWLVNARVPHSLTFTPDAAWGVAMLIERDAAWNQVWHLPTTTDPPTGRAFIEMAAVSFGVAPKYRVLTKPMLRLVGLFNPAVRESLEMLYQSERPYIFDSSKFAAEFGFSGTPYADGIRIAAQSYQK